MAVAVVYAQFQHYRTDVAIKKKDQALRQRGNSLTSKKCWRMSRRRRNHGGPVHQSEARGLSTQVLSRFAARLLAAQQRRSNDLCRERTNFLYLGCGLMVQLDGGLARVRELAKMRTTFTPASHERNSLLRFNDPIRVPY